GARLLERPRHSFYHFDRDQTRDPAVLFFGRRTLRGLGPLPFPRSLLAKVRQQIRASTQGPDERRRDGIDRLGHPQVVDPREREPRFALAVAALQAEAIGLRVLRKRREEAVQVVADRARRLAELPPERRRG